MPAVLLTTEAVSRIDLVKPGAHTAQIFYRDTKLVGFGLRVGTQSKVYIVEARVRGSGKPVRVKIGHHGVFTAEQARNRAKTILGDIAGGKNPLDEAKAARAT